MLLALPPCRRFAWSSNGLSAAATKPGIEREQGSAVGTGMPNASSAAAMSGSNRFLLGGKESDRLTQACQGKYLAVMIAQLTGQQPLLLLLEPNQQRDQKADAAAVHILQPLKI